MVKLLPLTRADAAEPGTPRGTEPGRSTALKTMPSLLHSYRAAGYRAHLQTRYRG